MRVCLLGTSQLICLKQALPNSDLRRDEFVFWGASGRGFATVSFQAGRLVPAPELVGMFRATSGGLYGELPIEEFDVLSFHGGLPLPLCLRYVVAAKKSQRFMSSALFDAVIRDILFRTKTFELASEIRRVSDVRILVSINPLPTGGLNENVFPSEILEHVEKVARQIASEMSVELLEQPPETLTADRRGTRKEFSFRGDRVHMNEAFGALVLKELKPHLSP